MITRFFCFFCVLDIDDQGPPQFYFPFIIWEFAEQEKIGKDTEVVSYCILHGFLLDWLPVMANEASLPY